MRSPMTLWVCSLVYAEPVGTGFFLIIFFLIIYSRANFYFMIYPEFLICSAPPRKDAILNQDSKLNSGRSKVHYNRVEWPSELQIKLWKVQISITYNRKICITKFLWYFSYPPKVNSKIWQEIDFRPNGQKTTFRPWLLSTQSSVK